MAALALTDVLADIPDPRSRHGRVHSPGAVLGLVVLAHVLGFRRGKTPAPRAACSPNSPTS